MAEIEDEKGNVRWYVELTCPRGHEVRPSGRLIRHRSGTQSFLVTNLERGCVYCQLEDEKAVAQTMATDAMLKAGWRIVGTGGGCEAWFKRVADASYLVTLEDDPSLPIAAKPAVLGFFENPAADGEAAWTTRIPAFDGPRSIEAAERALRAAQVDPKGA